MLASKYLDAALELIRNLRDEQVEAIEQAAELIAQAVASLQGELVTIESNVASLVKEMDASIAEANKFIKSMAAE